MQSREIIIQNLVVLGEKGEWELDSDNEIKENDNPVPRLIQHLSHCALFAAEAHKDAQLIDTEACELITRLSMSEFSCYTKDKPLTLAQYKQLIEAIPGIVKDLAPNIHLVLGTFAVEWPDGTIHNTGLHVQTPKEHEAPLIHHFEKQNPFLGDPRYFKDNGDIYPLFGADGKTYTCMDHWPDRVLKDTGVACFDMNQFVNAIKVITRDGQEFIVAIDICLDHIYKSALSHAIYLQKILADNGHSVPKRGSHVISSDTVIAQPDSTISRNYVHADKDAKLETLSDITVLAPAFGKPYRLITCKLQAVQALCADNIHYYKTNMRLYSEYMSRFNPKPAASSSHETAPITSMPSAMGFFSSHTPPICPPQRASFDFKP